MSETTQRISMEFGTDNYGTNSILRVQVLTAVSVKTVLWDVSVCSVVKIDQVSEGRTASIIGEMPKLNSKMPCSGMLRRVVL